MRQTLVYLAILLLSSTALMSQSMEELKEMHVEKMAAISDLESKIAGLQTEADGLQAEIDKLSGWRKGINGILGFDWNNNSGWVANPNPDARSSSLSIGLTGYLLNDREKTFWYNKGIIQKAYQDVDLNDADRSATDDGLLDNGTVDLLNISSLAGYRVTEKLAISGLAELNTSIGNFLDPGTLDIGVGVTWLPLKNLTVVVHPLNYHYAFAGIDGLSSTGAFGAKFRVDYFNDFNVSGVDVNWTSTLTGFVPYGGNIDPVTLTDGTVFNPGLTEYSWINTLSFNVWQGIGVGFGWGLRKADFESSNTQSYYTVGLSYSF